jgi:uncharacterized protein with NRDE domain
MCILLCFHAKLQGYGFVMIHNRDEVMSRKTSGCHLREHDRVLCARDEQSGGTWMGLQVDNARLAALTNFRELYSQPKNSRGDVVLNALHMKAVPESAERIEGAMGAGGFNMIVVDLFADQCQPRFYSNRAKLGSDSKISPSSKSECECSSSSATITVEQESKGYTRLADVCLTLDVGRFYSVSNSTLNDERWPKVMHVLSAADSTFGGGAVDEKLPLGELVHRLERIMCARPNFDEATHANDFESPWGVADEADLQRNVFVRVPNDGSRPIEEMTRSQALCIVEYVADNRRVVHYLHRSTEKAFANDEQFAPDEPFEHWIVSPGGNIERVDSILSVFAK